MLRLALFILEESESGSQTENCTLEHKGKGAEQQVAEFISLHYAEEHSAKELAAMCYLSESQLRRRFVCAYGMPPIAYRNALRCRIAEELLSTTSLTVAEISTRVGFKCTSDLYRSFYRLYSVSPRKYRNKSI